MTSVYAPVSAAGAKPIAFGDLSYYWIADRQGRSLKRLNELFAMNGQVGFLASQRVDGKLSTAKNLVMDVGRMDESALAENEDTVRTAMLFALGYLYENRSNPDYQKLTLNLRSILFAQREGVI